jgi:hypothetical protein
VNNPPVVESRSRLETDLRFDELVERWAVDRSPRPQSVHDTKVAVKDLIAFFGDVAVATFTKDMLLDYRDAARVMPIDMPRADRALPFPDRFAKYKGNT